MTSGVTISGAIKNGTTYTVDFNTAGTKACNVTVSHRFSNPIMIISTPLTVNVTIGENSVPINLGFIVNAYDITFDLYDGPGTFNFSTPSTDYEKLEHLANYVLDVKTLTLDGQTFTGHIENMRIDWIAGKKNVSEGCTMTFHTTKDVPTS